MKRIAALLAALVLSFCFSSAFAEAPLSFPQPLDYGDPAMWPYFAMGDHRDADVFLICPTVDTRSETNSFDLNDKLKARFISTLDGLKGLFDETGRLYSPYYRQMSVPACGLSADAQEKALAIAYRDVSDAFRWYLEHENNGRPLILAGFSQGAMMCQELLKEFFDNSRLMDRLIAVYCIGWRITREMTEQYPQIVPASGETDTGSVICFDCEDGSLSGTYVIPEGTVSLSINPLNWRTDGTPADRSLNLGAVLQTGAEPVPGFCGAYIGSRGELVVTGIDASDYPPGLSVFPSGAYHIYDCMFFFTNIKENVALRTQVYLAAEKQNAA